MTPRRSASVDSTSGPAAERGGLTAAMLMTPRGYWTDAAGYQRFLYVVAALLPASGLLAVAGLRGRSQGMPAPGRPA
jgi:hypothetical protein